MKVAFLGAFAMRFADTVVARMEIPCNMLSQRELTVLDGLKDTDVIVSMAFDARISAAAPQLRLVQVPGAGLDQIDRNALRPGTRLANVFGHEIGIAEYILGAMISLGRSFSHLDAALRQGTWHSQWAV